MFYRYQRRFKPRRKIDWLIDIVCVVLCIMPVLLSGPIYNHFDFMTYLRISKALLNTTRFAIIVFLLFNLAALYPHVLVFLLPVREDNREKLVQIYYNMLNTMKLVCVTSTVILYPIYMFLQLPTVFFILIMLIAVVIIGRLYFNNMKATAESKEAA